MSHILLVMITLCQKIFFICRGQYILIEDFVESQIIKNPYDYNYLAPDKELFFKTLAELSEVDDGLRSRKMQIQKFFYEMKRKYSKR